MYNSLAVVVMAPALPVSSSGATCTATAVVALVNRSSEQLLSVAEFFVLRTKLRHWSSEESTGLDYNSVTTASSLPAVQQLPAALSPSFSVFVPAMHRLEAARDLLR